MSSLMSLMSPSSSSALGSERLVVVETGAVEQQHRSKRHPNAVHTVQTLSEYLDSNSSPSTTYSTILILNGSPALRGIEIGRQVSPSSIPTVDHPVARVHSTQYKCSFCTYLPPIYLRSP